jgi:hypothetical protein
MSHSVKELRRLRERFVLWLLSLVERCMFSVLPRGQLRRRMRDRIDSALRRRPVTPLADQLARGSARERARAERRTR